MMPALRKRRLKVNKELRQIVGEKVRHLRATDRGYYGMLEKPFIESWAHRRGIKEYERRIFGEKKGVLIDIIRRRLEQRKQLSVLDVGCGSCRFLAELRRFFGDKLELHGITLALPFSPKQLEKLKEKSEERRGFALSEEEKKNFTKIKKLSEAIRRRVKKGGIKVHIGFAETHNYGKKFDLIFSAEAFVHMINPFQALENTLNHLKAGGQAYISFGVRDILVEEPEIRKRLIEQGIEIVSLSPGAYIFRRNKNMRIRIA